MQANSSGLKKTVRRFMNSQERYKCGFKAMLKQVHATHDCVDSRECVDSRAGRVRQCKVDQAESELDQASVLMTEERQTEEAKETRAFLCAFQTKSHAPNSQSSSSSKVSSSLWIFC